jgi:hypothetical protein
METGLCQPANIILIVSIAGVVYQLLVGEYYSVFWWIMVGVFGSGTFQLLCNGGLSPLAWILMMIPVLIVCFFMAIALFASQLRIQNIRKEECSATENVATSDCSKCCDRV